MTTCQWPTEMSNTITACQWVAMMNHAMTTGRWLPMMDSCHDRCSMASNDGSCHNRLSMATNDGSCHDHIALDLTSLQMWHPLITESELDGCIHSLMNYLDKTGVPLPTRTYDSVTIIHNALTEGV